MNKRHHIVIRRWLYVPVGIVLFVVGLILFPLPIPFGLILMILGLFLMAYNPLVMRFLRRTRARFPEISHKLRTITPHMPSFLARFLRRTDTQSGRAKTKSSPVAASRSDQAS